MSKREARYRRGLKTRIRIRDLGVNRLTVHRTPRHIYAQIISAEGNKVLASSSTLVASVKSQIKNGGNIEAAQAVGKDIAEKAKALNITSVAFDRSGFKFHGRIKALADSARESGLEF
ncbi:50S ribosomal protein L18 [Ignatzschineria sp. RMDPL8A]|uniref:50S ribosomal protein L18 n=1 Tax=Ignatzschineria sp. RMDPL8A TaxID=2999236 RepID=UPI0016A59CFE|nr:50S ribosomal protein L18 [Ignatzschineria sp. RMDPL8A]MDG9729506.1 50S ribosomal protein L18 [Ignatzschineria sp. RMDPL8A]NLD07974.1 50S ribosomal protein L18 [Xanthomonadaceae bacterium]